jgi:hypothetical protein
MRTRQSLSLLVMGALLPMLFMTTVTLADWDPTMPTKWVQLPDLNPLPGAITGMDVNATWRVNAVPPQPVFPFVKVLADDFPCTTTGPITGIHVWGSWLNDQINPNTTFHLSIHADVPGSPAAGVYSYPGSVLWQQDFTPGSYITKPYAAATELFYDPNTNQILGQDTHVLLYNFPIPLSKAFVQQGTTANPMVYWLDVQATVPGTEVFGWKTSVNHWNDDAAFADTTLPLSMGGSLYGPAPSPVFWQDMHYPAGHPYAGQSIDLSFAITTVPEPASLGMLGIAAAGLLARRQRLTGVRQTA